MALTKVSRGLLSTSIVDNGNATAITIDSSENVGIGVTPSFKFHVKDTFSALAFEHSGGNAVLKIDGGNGDLSGSDFSSITDIGGTLLFGTNGGSEVMRILSNQRVSIGGTSSNHLLNVTSSTTPALEFTRGSGNATIGIDNGNSIAVGGTAGDLVLRASGTTGVTKFTDSGGNITMTLTEANNVGIGTTSPQAAKFSSTASGILELAGTKPVINIHETDVTDAEFFMGMSGGNALLGTSGTGVLIFKTGTSSTSERMRIDSSGNLLVGKTANDNSTQGGSIRAGESSFVSGDSRALTVVRTTNDGDLIQFRKAGSTVGSVGTLSSALTIGTGDTGVQFNADNNAIFPHNITTGANVDATIDIGYSSGGTSRRFKDLFMAGAVKGGNGSASAPTFSFGNSTTMGMYRGAANQLAFSTSSTERMRLNGSGDLLVGTTTSFGLLSVRDATGSSTSITARFLGGASNDSLLIRGDGDAENTNNSYGAISDVRVKENIVDASPKLEDLMRVQVRNYNLIGRTQKQIGVVAQELEQVFPGMIKESPEIDTNGQETGETRKSVKYSVFVPMLIKAMQEQQATITALETRITQLENN